MKVRFHTDDIIEYYNIYDHNTAFSVAQKQEILQELAAMVEKDKREEKMYYHLQYGLLDIKDDHIPNDGIGAFLTDLNEVKQYIQQEWCKYDARTQHYERLYQIVEVLEVLPDGHIAEYKKLDEAEEQQHKKPDEVEQQQELGSAPCDTEKD
jgi:hypothetical protein